MRSPSGSRRVATIGSRASPPLFATIGSRLSLRSRRLALADRHRARMLCGLGHHRLISNAKPNVGEAERPVGGGRGGGRGRGRRSGDRGGDRPTGDGVGDGAVRIFGEAGARRSRGVGEGAAIARPVRSWRRAVKSLERPSEEVEAWEKERA
ncbi:hypothetical protein Scep_007917 [Stephania cephalantha]|uniref:Uncharacterized protein n=1 Tax=Stephania cephalantha TaxID=152367 RepID=A0AAP0KDF2_9MAGN